MTYIEQRLEELNEEKEELKLYQEHDRRRRCLEYTIYSREQKEVSEALEEVRERECWFSTMSAIFNVLWTDLGPFSMVKDGGGTQARARWIKPTTKGL